MAITESINTYKDDRGSKPSRWIAGGWRGAGFPHKSHYSGGGYILLFYEVFYSTKIVNQV
jgi:hypothetical protein